MAWYDKETKGMILDTKTLRTLVFQFNPIVIKDSYKPRYTDHHIPGLTFPRSQWGNGTNRTLEFALEWLFQERHSLDVRNSCEFLQSLMYPDYMYSSKLVKAPRILLFKFGKMYCGYYEMRKCEVTYDTIWEKTYLLARKAKCEITLKQADIDAPSMSISNIRASLITQQKKSSGTKLLNDVVTGVTEEAVKSARAIGTLQHNPVDVMWERELKVDSQVIGFGSTLGIS